MGEATRALADWVYAKTWESTSVADQQSVLDSVVDTVGVALAGTREHVSILVREHVLSTFRPGTAQVWGTKHCLSQVGAALCNGTAAMSQEFDDRHIRHGHPSCVLVPALLSAAQAESLGGWQLLEGYVAGVGVFAAAGYLYGAHREPRLEPRGWHITAILGTIGAAAGVAKAIGLDAGQIATAMGIAASLTAGLSGNATSPTKSVHAGRAASSGIDAAMLARSGLTCADGALDGEHGAMMAFGHQPGAAVITGPDVIDELLAIAEQGSGGLIRKRFPTFGATHLAIEAALDVRSQLPVGAELAAIHVRLPPPRGGRVVSFTGKPTTPEEARHSFRYVVAAALARGELLPAHFARDALFDPATRAVWPLVAVSEDGAEGNYAEVTVQLAGGQRFAKRREFPPQMISGPVVDAKFLGCAGVIMDRTAAGELLTRLRGLADRADMTGLLRF
jgi:2-methylcitrate dehydratase PrpD